MEEAPRRPLFWLFAIACAVAAFLYVAVYDVARVHKRGPSLSGEELLILARHGVIERGAVVSCDDHGETVTGSVVGLPGELAVTSAAGVRVPQKAHDRFGGSIERIAAVVPTPSDEDPNVKVAAEPGEILVSPQGSLDSAPKPMRAARCLPVVRRVRLGAP